MSTAGAVMTVAGPVPAQALQRTLMHEHVVHRLGDVMAPSANALRDARVTPEVAVQIRRSPFECVDNITFDDERLAVAELGLLAARGANAVVDVTTTELGRSATSLRHVAAESGVHIVASCGHYVGQTLPAELHRASDVQIAERLIDELIVGIDGTAIRAGMIKIGTSSPPRPIEEKMLRSAAIAQAAVGAPITVHLSNLGRSSSHGHEVLATLELAGADLGRVILAHVDLLFGAGGQEAGSHLVSLAARGSVLGFDTCGYTGEISLEGGAQVRYPSDEQRAQAIAALLDAGYGAQMIVSNDIVTKDRLAAFGGSGYGHPFGAFAELLADLGLGTSERDALFIDNPRRLLTLPPHGAA